MRAACKVEQSAVERVEGLLSDGLSRAVVCYRMDVKVYTRCWAVAEPSREGEEREDEKGKDLIESASEGDGRPFRRRPFCSFFWVVVSGR